MSDEIGTSPVAVPSEDSGEIDWRFIAVILVITITPFLFFATQIDALVLEWAKRPTTTLHVWLAVVGLLWADILLPIPSSVVNTFAGAKLGWLGAFVASDLGMTLAAATAFAIGRFAELLKISKLTSMQETLGNAGVSRWGPWAIVISRGIPLVAEVVLIYVASKRMSFWHFIWPALVANTFISLGYAILGEWAAEREWLAVVLGASGIFPLLLGLAVRQWLLKR